MWGINLGNFSHETSFAKLVSLIGVLEHQLSFVYLFSLIFEIFFFVWSFCWQHSWGNDFAVQCLSLIGFIEKMEIWLSRFMIHFGFIWMNDNIQWKDDKHPFTNFVGVWVWHLHGSTLPILLRMAKEVCITCTPVNPHKFWTYWPSGSMAK